MAKTNSNIKKRALILTAVLLLVGFGGNLVRLFQLQVIDAADYKAKAEAQQPKDQAQQGQQGQKPQQAQPQQGKKPQDRQPQVQNLRVTEG